MKPEEAIEWMIGQSILGVEYADDDLKLIFKEGYVEISGDDFEVYVSTED
jgi:hypothetical protein